MGRFKNFEKSEYSRYQGTLPGSNTHAKVKTNKTKQNPGSKEQKLSFFYVFDHVDKMRLKYPPLVRVKSDKLRKIKFYSISQPIHARL